MRFHVRQKEKASPRGWGVGSIQSPQRSPATLRWRRHPVRLGACEARWSRVVANREDDRPCL